MNLIYTQKIKNSFNNVADALFDDLRQTEEVVLNLAAEDSIFVRFNNNNVRQNTHVEQANVSLKLQTDGRTTNYSFTISGEAAQDQAKAFRILQMARQECAQLPPDEHQSPLRNNGQSFNEHAFSLLSDSEIIEAITGPASGQDLAGLYTAGPLISANRNSKGQNHWFATGNFFMDYSLYDKEKAAKGIYAGSHWSQKDFEQSLQQTRVALDLLHRPKVQLKPGTYKVYLAPAAVAEIASMLNWGALSYRAFRDGSSAFKKWADGEKTLSPLFSVHENFALGMTTPFNELGEVAPEKTIIAEAGKLEQFLISSRSAKEYGVKSNFAGESESFRAMEIRPGSLKREDILKKIGTGLYLSNLHYINWSDRPSARITGMTRYACFWVENGEIVGPIADMRFDESLYAAFGPQLLEVTEFQEVDPEVNTYGSRSLGGKKLPGMLIEDFTLTL